jgi:hypothetical protein
MRMTRSVRTRELTTLGLAVACVHGICANDMQVRVALTRDCARGDVHMSIATFIHMTHRRVDVECSYGRRGVFVLRCAIGTALIRGGMSVPTSACVAIDNMTD